MKRTPENCLYRECKDATSQCRLLSQISGVDNDALAEVNEDVCSACCESFLPTEDDWNPVIASLVHSIAETVQESGDTGCSRERAIELAETAISHMPIVLPDEDDCLDDFQNIRAPSQVSTEQLAIFLPIPHRDHSTLRTWAVGVTTAPRRQPTLTPSLKSLQESGWDEPILFIDGQVDVDEQFGGLRQFRRDKPSGAWPAWCFAAQTLLDSSPMADAIMIVQDDAIFPGVKAIKPYVESCLWPRDSNLDRPSIVSLYTSNDDSLDENRWRALPTRWKYGAVALAFPRAQLIDLLTSEKQGLMDGLVEGHAGIDSRIGHWAERRGVDIWHPSPSLVQHIGQVSSVWARSRAVGLRRASRFIADELNGE